FYFLSDLEYDLEDLRQNQTSELMSQALEVVVNKLSDLSDRTLENWENVVRLTADDLGLNHKDLFMSMRSALTARKFTPPLYDVMKALGWQKSFDRLRSAANYLLEQ
ncbi:MAG: Glutamate--tRNA ligase, partial [Microgenomates bacterium 39_7]